MRKLSLLIIALAACGGGAKSSGLGKGGGVPPPPPNVGGNTATDATAGTAGDVKTQKIEFSKDAKKDYEAAVETFKANDKSGWTEGSCRSTADRFSAVAREHKIVDAQFMAGLSFHRCNLMSDAEKAYQEASRMPGDGLKKAMALSNLGEIYYKAGKIDGAKQYWDSALKANGKLVAARINVASMQLDQMRKLNNPKDPKWKTLEEDARIHLSNALGVDSESVYAYTMYGLVYMEGWKSNKNRLDLAKLLLDEGKKRNEKFAPLQNAYGLYYLHRNALSEALQHFQAAVTLDPKFVEARMNVGLITLGFRKYDTAKEQFTAVLEIQPKNYDAMIGLGAALRGLKDLDGAEAQYKKAKDLDSRRGEAYYNLGVLYKDFRATKQEAQQSIATYKTAKGFFQDFLSKSGGSPEDQAEAKEQVALIDKTITQTEKFLKAMAQAEAMQKSQPQPAPTPAPAGPPKK